MKVALLGPYPVNLKAPAGQPPLLGGVDAVVIALARGLARRSEVSVSVVTAVAGLAQPIQCPGEGYTLYCVPRPRGGRLTGQREVVGLLRQQIDALAPDIVHAHIAGIYARAAVTSGCPNVVTLHGIIYRETQQAWATCTWPTRLRWISDALFEHATVRRAPEVIAISPYVQREFRGRTAARFHLVENPVDDRFFAVTGPPPGRDRLLCVGRLMPRKGILALFDAFEQILAVRPDATLTIVGETTSDPVYAAQCRARAAAPALRDRVRFAGAQPPDVVQAELAACDVMLLASEQETAPVSIAEAMAAGRAVVTTDVGGCAAMVADGVTGRVVPAKDPAALAAATLELLADPARCRALGQAGRAAAEARFRLDPIVDATLAVYRRILGPDPHVTQEHP